MNSHDKEEKCQVIPLYAYAIRHPSATYEFTFKDGERYIGTFEDAFETDNRADLDLDDDSLIVDEFRQMIFHVQPISNSGKRLYDGHLALDYRDWPATIVDLENRTRVFPCEQNDPLTD